VAIRLSGLGGLSRHRAHSLKNVNEDVRNVQTALATITEHWQPHRLTSINDYDVKVVKLQGEFVWHTHPDTDELFMVVRGELTIQLRDRDVVLGPNDVFVVPKGVEHCPRADEEVHAILFEPKGTVNTGDAGGELTAKLREFD
jgi:mannose-6-phosphate isomerase-like protein (cupin superfamily)